MSASETVQNPKQYAAQDQKIADAIAAARQTIETARNDPELAAILSQRGYDAAQLAAGLDLQAAAQAAFNARQGAMAARQQAAAAESEAFAAARQAYVDFRSVVRAVYVASADRAALGATGVVPRDVQKFLTLARAAYAAARQEPFASHLAQYGYAAPAVEAAIAALDALDAADQAHNAAAGAARQATIQRDAAYRDLNAWVKQFKQIARVALRSRPDLAQKLLL